MRATCFGGDLARQCLSLTGGKGGFFPSWSQVWKMNPAVYLSWVAPVWYLSPFDSSKSQMFCSWLWSGRRDGESGRLCQCCAVMQRSSKRLQKARSRCRYGLMCRLCTALRSLTALMCRGCGWKSQSRAGAAKAPLSEARWHRCVASLWQRLQHLAAFLVKGIEARCGRRTGRILQHLDGSLYPRLGCNSWVD